MCCFRSLTFDFFFQTLNSMIRYFHEQHSCCHTITYIMFSTFGKLAIPKHPCLFFLTSWTVMGNLMNWLTMFWLLKAEITSFTILLTVGWLTRYISASFNWIGQTGYYCCDSCWQTVVSFCFGWDTVMKKYLKKLFSSSIKPILANQLLIFFVLSTAINLFAMPGIANITIMCKICQFNSFITNNKVWYCLVEWRYLILYFYIHYNFM